MTHVRTLNSEAMSDRRWLADELGLSLECSHRICRRKGRCRGPGAESAAFPGEELPSCLVAGFDELYAPVARWEALLRMISRLGELLAERGVVSGGANKPR